jgi:hypothetical protein
MTLQNFRSWDCSNRRFRPVDAKPVSRQPHHRLFNPFPWPHDPAKGWPHGPANWHPCSFFVLCWTCSLADCGGRVSVRRASQGASDGSDDAANSAEGADNNPSEAEAGPVVSSSSCVEAAPAGTCVDADIQAANYDQSCESDSDCILVGEGPACDPCALAYGPWGAVSHAGLMRLIADLAKTPGGQAQPVSCAPAYVPSPAVCCRDGHCQADASCAQNQGD